MIKEKSVFIFGAGLSADYSFPTNFQLRDRIIDLLTWSQSNPKLPRQIELLKENFYFDIDKILKFRIQLEDGGFDTIDAFLEKREDEISRALGKMAIAMALIGYENPNAFKKKSSRNCFYTFLFNRMVEGTTKENFQDNPISIITYNYDRSFETFLWTRLKNYFDISDQETDKIIRNIKIIHVHGMLGDMHWQSPNHRDYRTDFDHYSLLLASKGIVNFNEISNDYHRYQEARKEIAGAKNVVFLGFGFHNLNLSRLTQGNCLDGKKRILATRGKSITDGKVEEISNITKGKLQSGHMRKKNAVTLAQEDLDWL